MNEIPKIKDILQIMKKGEDKQYHSIQSEEEVSDDTKLLVFDILFRFSNLEDNLDTFIYMLYTDRADTLGIIETEGFNVSKKIELFKRKMYLAKKHSDSFTFSDKEIMDVLDMLKGSSQIRNIIAHIKWNSLFSGNGYTKGTNESEAYELYFHKYKLNKKYDLDAEYINCTKEKLVEMHEYIEQTDELLDMLRAKYSINFF